MGVSCVNLIGQRFGRLIVKEKDTLKKYHWICICDCGNSKSITQHSLTTGYTKSCGCYRNEKSKERCKKSNIYDLTGHYGVGILTDDITKFYFDQEDYNKISKYTWYCLRGYVYTSPTWKGTPFPLARIIMNPPEDMVVYHINGNPLDNRKENLRICTQHNNSMNLKKGKNNTSGTTGVYYVKQKDVWRATIMFLYKSIHLGEFKNIDDAIKARKEAEIKYFGEFVRKEDII